MIMKDRLCDDESTVKIQSVPKYVTCPKCGGEIVLWSRSLLTVCWFCGFHAFKKEMIIN